MSYIGLFLYLELFQILFTLWKRGFTMTTSLPCYRLFIITVGTPLNHQSNKEY